MFRTEVGNININTRGSWIISVEFAGLKIQIDVIFLLCKLVRECVYVSELYCRSRLLCLVKYFKYCNEDYVNSFAYIILKKTD